MKRLYFLLFIVFSCITSKAQLNGSGYYRVQNVGSERFIIVTNNEGAINYTSTSVDLSSLQTIRPFSQVESDAASVIYIEEAAAGYVLHAQGTDTKTMSGGAYLTITARSDGSYMAGASKGGITKYLCDSKSNGDIGKVTDNNSARRNWYIKPVNQSSGQYFGIKPTVSCNGLYYHTFYAAFPFSFASSGMKAYYVELIDATLGIAVYAEATGAVPASTPVIISCSSSSASQNKLTLGTSATPHTANVLTGVYFDRLDEEENIDNRVLNNPTTMRFLGVTSTGKLGFVKSSVVAVPRNTAYLSVPANAPAELVLMTKAEYEVEKQKLTDVVTITANNKTRKYGEANPSFDYTVSGTGTLHGEPQLSCAATATSPVGNYPIVVSKGTVSNYGFTGVNGTLTVTKAQLTATAQSYTIKQTDALPAFAVTYTGFKNGENESVVTTKATVTTDAPADKKPGVYNIIVSGASASNYDFAYVAGKLTILEADPITLRADDKTMVYGDAVPAFTYTATGGTVAITGTPAISCAATSNSPVGTYPIQISQGTVNYPNLKFVNGTLTVNKAPLTVTAQSYTIKQNEDLPTYAVTYSGFKNGEGEGVLSTKPVFTVNVPADKTPGVYDIVVSGVTADNYAVTHVAGKLTILEADVVTVTVKDCSRRYGAENPAFEYTITGAASLQGTPVITCSADRQSPVATYPIAISAGSINYPNLKLVNGTLSVTKAPLTVTPQSYTIKQTDNLPELEAVYTGFVNDETEAVLTKEAVLTVEVPADKTPGVYDIVAKDAEAQNYEMQYVVGKLTILEADPITVVAHHATMVYGDAVPEFTYEIQGGTLEGQPEFSCVVTSQSSVGDYEIMLSKGTLDYPNLHFMTGILSVTKAPLEVSVADERIVQGEKMPPFKLSYQGFRNGDNESMLLEKPVPVTLATSNSPVGDYAINILGGEAENYYFTYVSGTLTIAVRSSIASQHLFARPSDVYTVTGRKVRSQVTSLEGLPKGIYIIGGRKVVVE